MTDLTHDQQVRAAALNILAQRPTKLYGVEMPYARRDEDNDRVSLTFEAQAVLKLLEEYIRHGGTSIPLGESDD